MRFVFGRLAAQLLPQGALAPHHSTAKIAKSAHQSALVAWWVTMANRMLMTMQISATRFPTPKVMSHPPVGSPSIETPYAGWPILVASGTSIKAALYVIAIAVYRHGVGDERMQPDASNIAGDAFGLTLYGQPVDEVSLRGTRTHLLAYFSPRQTGACGCSYFKQIRASYVLSGERRPPRQDNLEDCTPGPAADRDAAAMPFDNRLHNRQSEPAAARHPGARGALRAVEWAR